MKRRTSIRAGAGFRRLWLSPAMLGMFIGAQGVMAQPGCLNAGMVLSHAKISQTEGGFTGVLDAEDRFGVGVRAIGDIDGDGIVDLGVGAFNDDDGGADRGAFWILFLNADGSVKAHQKISDTEGGFTGALDNNDRFGSGIASLGDLDGDGVGDVAVGADLDDDGNTDRGAVWILFLNTDGTVKSHQKISDTQGGFTGTFLTGDRFGYGIDSLGDLDGDGIGDIAVGAFGHDDGGTDRGAVWILFLNTNGTVKAHQKISGSAGGFTGTLDNGDIFGIGVATIGDLDGDGVVDIAVGAFDDDDGGVDAGAVWLLFLNTDGTVKVTQKVSALAGGFTGSLGSADGFGRDISAIGDLDGDGVVDLAVGAIGDDDGGTERGAVWILFLNTNGTVKAHQKISSTSGGFTGAIDDVDQIGFGLGYLGDLDGDGRSELAVGALLDDDGDTNAGAVWILTLDACDVPPKIVTDPTSVLLASMGASAMFSVVADGAPTLLYQWYRDGLPLSDGGHISGATTDTLDINPASPADVGIYDCIVTNDFGAAQSAGAILGLRPGCYPDCEQDGDLDVFDFLCFQNLYGVGCP